MIKEPKDMESLTLTVVAKDGAVYSKRDTTANPFGQNERVVMFWDESGLVTLPMANVQSVTFHFDS